MTIGGSLTFSPRQRTAAGISIATAILAVTIAALLAEGRVPWCRCGSIKVWSSNIWSSENSQQLTDPYTVTHLTHGVAFYGLLRIVAGGLPLGWRGLLALTLESGWEVFENTDFVIRRYRAATIALDYDGDSVINSLGDIFAAMLGFVLASRLPASVTAIGIILLEGLLMLWIRDSLVLNILMLLVPIPALKHWQLGG